MFVALIRELLDDGWEFYWIKLYKKSQISIGSLSKNLDKSISETIDILVDLGIESQISYDDFLKGYENLKQI